MGSAQSTRKITVNNESAHIIKVSDSVIDRLKNIDKQTSNASQFNSPSNLSNQVVQTPVVTPGVSYAGSLTSLQVLQEKEKQLIENDQYWATRVQALKGVQSESIRRMEQEFSKTVSTLEERIPKAYKTKPAEAPCGEKKSKVLECYQRHPKQILLCAKEVAEFADCVDTKRLAAA